MSHEESQLNLTLAHCDPGTHKLKKTELQKEAYNIENITDDVYIINSKMKTYSKVDVEMYNNILNGNMRF